MYTGIGRDDWGFGVRQSFRPSDRTTIQSQLQFPAHRNLVATANVNHNFNGLQMSLNSTYLQTLKGPRNTDFTTNLIAELDPWNYGRVPFRSYLGFSAEASRHTGLFNQSREAVGLRLRSISNPLNPGPGQSITISHQANLLSGRGVTAPFTQTLAINWSGQFGNSFSSNLGYEYGDDPFTTQALGRHRMTLDALYSEGRFRLSSYLSSSFDINRRTISAQAAYRVGPLWNIYGTYFQDTFKDFSYLDQSIILSYRLGFREIGISYSGRTHRFGFELLGTTGF
jgi:hypothetical protein